MTGLLSQGSGETESEQYVDENQSVTLPTKATANDIREVIRFLKRKPEGATLLEVNDAIRRRLFDPRKVFAYELWGIVSRVGNRLVLSNKGWEFAERLSLEREVYRAILERTPPYRSALQWVHQQSLEVVTYEDIANFWRQQHPDAVEDGESEAYGSCFFQICHAAEIGMVTSGRKGQPTRLRIFKDDLEAYLRTSVDASIQLASTLSTSHTNGNALAVISKVGRRVADSQTGNIKVLVSCGDNPELASRLKTTLDLAEIESVFIVRTSADNAPLDEGISEVMQECQLGLIVVTAEDYISEDGKDHLAQHVMIEIGAAFVHFNKLVLLMVDSSRRLPPIFGGLPLIEFEANSPSWETVIQVTHLIKSMRLGQCIEDQDKLERKTI